jgi:hypothetical protein
MDFGNAADTGLQDRKCAQDPVRTATTNQLLSAKHWSFNEALKFGERLSI